MATRTMNVAPDSTSDAAFRAWGKPISDAFAAFGWTPAPHNPATTDWVAGHCPTSSDPTGWPVEYWMMGDSLATARPVMLQVAYGRSAGGAPAIGFLVFDASDVTGTPLTGFGTPTRKTLALNSTSATLCHSRMCGNAASFILAFFYDDPAETGWYWSIERTKDASGADTISGFIAITQLCNGQGQTCIGTTTVAPGVWDNRMACILPTTGSTAASGVNVGVSPVIPQLGGAQPPGIAQLMYKSADFAAGTPFAALIYGASHTYMPMGAAMALGAGGIYNEQLAMLWE